MNPISVAKMVAARVIRDFPFDAAVDHYARDKSERVSGDFMRLREEDLVCEEIAAQESLGLKRFRLFEETLENGFGRKWRRETVQREYHELCSSALAALILGDDWDRDGPELTRARGWTFRSQLVICKTPRRFGKSVATAMVAAALSKAFAIYPPAIEFKIGSFSTGKRASSGLADYCAQLLKACSVDDRIVKQNQETVWLMAGSVGDEDAPIIKNSFFPSNAKMSTPFSFSHFRRAWTALFSSLVERSRLSPVEGRKTIRGGAPQRDRSRRTRRRRRPRG